MVNERIQKAKQAPRRLREESKKQTTTAILAAFSFLLAFAWRDLIKGYVDHFVDNFLFLGPEHLIQVYATLLTTIFCVLGIILVARWTQKKEEEQPKK